MIAGEKRWTVAIQGEVFDLDDAERLSCGGPVHIGTIDIPDGKQVRALFSDDFEKADSAHGVLNIARGH